jgi:hypothetical protein
MDFGQDFDDLRFSQEEKCRAKEENIQRKASKVASKKEKSWLKIIVAFFHKII